MGERRYEYWLPCRWQGVLTGRSPQNEALNEPPVLILPLLSGGLGVGEL
jgi:hypothetical protein